MPIYEYLCADCNKSFEYLTRGSDEPKCPTCSGTKLEQQMSGFAVGSGRGARPANSCPMPPMGGCGGGGCGGGGCMMN